MLTRPAEGTATEIVVIDEAAPDATPAEPGAAAPRRRRAHTRMPSVLRFGARSWTWIGVLLAAAGFVLMAVAWGQVAGETQVYLQLPYLVSAGVVGLGVIMLGLTVLNVAAGQQDAAAREREIEQLLAAIDDLQQAMAKPRRRSR
jgi:hypothetical protein